MLSLNEVLSKVQFGQPVMKASNYYATAISVSGLQQAKTYSGTGEKVEERLWLESLHTYYDILQRKTVVNPDQTLIRFSEKLVSHIISDVGALVSQKDITLLYWCQRYMNNYSIKDDAPLLETLVGIYQYCSKPFAPGTMTGLEFNQLGCYMTIDPSKKDAFIMMFMALKNKLSTQKLWNRDDNPYAPRSRRRRRRRW